MANEDTVAVAFYAPWPNLGIKFSQQLGQIRTDTAHLSPLVRGMGLDAAGDFTTLDGVEKNAVQSREWGQVTFHNRFRMHYDKTNDLFDIAYNTGTEEVPNWYTTWTISKDGHVTQQNTPTTASNLGGVVSAQGAFFQKSGVDLEFKSLRAFYPLSLSSSDSLINFRTGAEANTYSSVVPSVSSGGTGGIESILADSGKVGVDFPFKAFEAGANAVITDTGSTIRFESTAQVVEFYGIAVQHSDGSVVYPEIHNFKVNVQQFYLTQDKTNPSQKSMILNFRGETLSSGSFVAVAGDFMLGQLQMHDGTASEPSIGFTSDLDTGMRLRGVADLAFSVAGTDRLRIQDDLLLTSVPIQITNAGTPAAPDYGFFPDIDTGIYQDAINSVAFATGGVHAGSFAGGQLHTPKVTAGVGYFYEGVLAEWGTQTAPGIRFIGAETTGIFKRHATNAQLAFVTGGVEAGWFNQNQKLVIVDEIYAGDGTAGGPAYSFIQSGQQDVGMYRSATDELSFATGGVRAGYFDSSQDFHALGQIIAEDAGGATKPEYSFLGETGKGMYDLTTNQIGWSYSSGNQGMSLRTTDLYVVGAMRGKDGTAGSPTYSFSDPAQVDVGMYKSGTDELAFATEGVQAGKFDANQDLTVTNRLYVEIGGTRLAPSYSFIGDTNTGMYREGPDTLSFTTRGSRVGHFDSNQDFYVRHNVHVEDDAFDATKWAGNMSVPTKNAMRDYLRDVAGGDGTSWTSRTSTVDNSWRSITYGNGLFVAVSFTGSSDRIMTSPDGINWTSRSNPVDNDWRSVTYGNGLFVAVASSGTNDRVMTSSDGINWTIRTSAADNNWLSVTYGNGLFVAISTDGTDNRVMISPDGITWTIRTSAANNAWRSVTYGNGLFVAVTSEDVGGDRVMTSPDGITWTSRIHSIDNNWFSVTYGNGLFVAVANTGTGDRVMTSPDGITWTTRTSAADNAWIGLTYGNGLFVAVATDGDPNQVMTSPDGITWTTRTSAADKGWVGVIYGNGMFVAVANSGTNNRIMTSGKTELNEVSTDNILQGGREVRNDLTVVGDVNAGRVEAGIGVFYTSLAVDGDVTIGSGTSEFQILSDGGNQSVPGYSFGVDPDTGIVGGVTANQIMVMCGGANITRFTTGGCTHFKLLLLDTSSNDLPVLVFGADTDTGVFQKGGSATNTWGWKTGGVEAGYFDAQQNLHVTNAILAGGTVRAEAFYLGVHNAEVSIDSTGALRLNAGNNKNIDVTTLPGTGHLFLNTDLDSSGGGFFLQAGGASQIETFNSAKLDILCGGFMDIIGTSRVELESTASNVRIRASSEVLIDNAPIRADDGSVVSTPAYAFNSDSDTGMYRNGVNSLGFATQGKRAGFFDSSQNLHVTGDLRSSRVEAGLGVFYTQINTDKIRIDRSGTNSDVSIGFADNIGIYFDTNIMQFTVLGGINIRMTSGTTSIREANLLLRATGGTISSPALAFHSDGNTGLSNDNNDDHIFFSTGGVEAAHFDPFQNFYVANSVYVKDVVEADKGQFYTSLSLNDSKMKFASDGILYAFDPTRQKFLSVSRTTLQLGRDLNVFTSASVLSPAGNVLGNALDIGNLMPRNATITAVTLQARAISVQEATINIHKFAIDASSSSIDTFEIPVGSPAGASFDNLDHDVDKNDSLIARLDNTGSTVSDIICNIEVAWRLAT